MGWDLRGRKVQTAIVIWREGKDKDGIVGYAQHTSLLANELAPLGYAVFRDCWHWPELIDFGVLVYRALVGCAYPTALDSSSPYQPITILDSITLRAASRSVPVCCM